MHAIHRRFFGAALTTLVAAFQIGVLAAPATAAGGALSVADKSVNEPASPGSRGTVTFKVTLTGDDGGPVTVDYQTVDATAKAGEDYLAQSGSLFFPGS